MTLTYYSVQKPACQFHGESSVSLGSRFWKRGMLRDLFPLRDKLNARSALNVHMEWYGMSQDEKNKFVKTQSINFISKTRSISVNGVLNAC